MREAVSYEQYGHVVVLTLDQPETRNALTDNGVATTLIVHCERISGDVGVRAIILTGRGPAFSSGGNIKHMREKQGIFAGGAQEVLEAYRVGIQRLARALYSIEVPTIAAVNGPAYGAECDAAMVCDIRIASETAIFAENFVKVGLISGFGGSWLLPRIAGHARAAEMTFTGDPIDALTAADWGIVSKVVPPDKLPLAAMELARRIAVNPPGVLRMAKRLLRAATTNDYFSMLETAAGFQSAAHTTQYHIEALDAVFEKRSGRYTGR